MTDHKKVLKNIESLENIIPNELFDFSEWDLKAIWNQIKITGASFKGVRFPTSDEHSEAWERFQNLVEQVKEKQSERNKDFERRAERSRELRNNLISRADRIVPVNEELFNFIMTVATGGAYLALKLTLDAIFGKFDDAKAELLRANADLKELWDEFSAQKSKLNREDKDAIFHSLKSAQDKLSDAWDSYKKERQAAYENYKVEKAEKQAKNSEKHEAWKRRTQENISKNERRLEKLNHVISHKRRHISSLNEKLYDASGNYRDRVNGWISEEETAILEIQEKIEQVRNYIAEDQERLNSSW